MSLLTETTRYILLYCTLADDRTAPAVAYYEIVFNDVLLIRRLHIVFQLLCIVSTILIRNPELTLKELNLDSLVTEANKMFCKVKYIAVVASGVADASKNLTLLTFTQQRSRLMKSARYTASLYTNCGSNFFFFFYKI